jgi:hypothetical protein
LHIKGFQDVWVLDNKAEPFNKQKYWKGAEIYMSKLAAFEQLTNKIVYLQNCGL